MPAARRRSAAALLSAVWLGMLPPAGAAAAPALADPNLAVTQIVTGLAQPTGMAFLGTDDFLILEKASGMVKRVVGGVVTATVLDLPVNSSSERGLLGIALDPGFPATPNVYLFWTESSTGVDSSALAEAVLLGNRVDRFTWETPGADPYPRGQPDSPALTPERQQQCAGPATPTPRGNR
ncbi:MAG: PQQ-dependent sugar dehydrogenase [Betaproteobacteria bacterium]|nr:PQQ-dependent sugar dehydrogenase [Betaproteobacteria bacterium]